jgi:hypothetical protein
MKKKRKKNKVSDFDKSFSRRVKHKRIAAQDVRDSVTEIREIPRGYGADTIVIMPVNTDTSFIYWEVTNRMLNGKKRILSAGSAQLMIKVFALNRKKEVYSFKADSRIGVHYMHYNSPCAPLVAEIGLLKGKKFTGLFKSHPMAVTSPGPTAGSDEVWMQRIKNTCTVIKEADHERVKNSARLNSLIMKYCQAAGASSPHPLYSVSLVKPPQAED